MPDPSRLGRPLHRRPPFLTQDRPMLMADHVADKKDLGRRVSSAGSSVSGLNLRWKGGARRPLCAASSTGARGGPEHSGPRPHPCTIGSSRVRA